MTQLDHSSPLNETTKMGTVGAVALDKAGNLAAATSTGGMTNKLAGLATVRCRAPGAMPITPRRRSPAPEPAKCLFARSPHMTLPP